MTEDSVARVVTAFTRGERQEAQASDARATVVSIVGMFSDGLAVQLVVLPQTRRDVGISRTFKLPMAGDINSDTIRVYTSLGRPAVPLALLSPTELTDTEQFIERAFGQNVPLRFDTNEIAQTMLVESSDNVLSLSQAPQRRDWVNTQVARMGLQFAHADAGSVYGRVAQGLRRIFNPAGTQ